MLVGKNRWNFYFGSSILGDTCDKITSWNKWELPGGVALPVTGVTETLRFFELVERQRSEQEALALAEVIFVLTNYVKKTKGLHPVVFIAAAAVVGIVFRFAGA